MVHFLLPPQLIEIFRSFHCPEYQWQPGLPSDAHICYMKNHTIGKFPKRKR